MKGNLIVISSPSGGGKGTLIREVLRVVPDIGYSVSFTTRAARAGEENARDYFFVGVDEFKRLIAAGEFLEYAEVHGNFYGTSLNQISAEMNLGRDIVLEIDVQGARSVREQIPEAVSIFIMPPSFEILRERLIARKTEKKEDLAVRLKNAFGEVREFEAFEYVVVNDDKRRAAENLKHIIFAERQKRVRQSAPIQDILNSFDATITNVLGE